MEQPSCSHGPDAGSFRASLQRLPRFSKELIAGGIAGALAKTSVAPLERVKILIQTGRVCHTDPVYPLLQKLVGQEGIWGLFRGNSANVARIVPYAAIHFGLYENFRRLIVDALCADSRRLNPVYDLVAGSAAGAAAVTITYPLDLVRTRLAWSLENQPTREFRVWTLGERLCRHTTLLGQALHIVKSEGPLGLYQGLGPSVAGVLPYAGMKFFVYHSLKQQYMVFQEKLGKPASERPPVQISLLFGAVAGLTAQTATYPLDVVRRRMQVQGAQRAAAAATTAAAAAAPGTLKATGEAAVGGSAAAAAAAAPEFMRSSLHGLKVVMREHGWKGLFYGLRINYWKVGPTTAIGFTTYEMVKDFLGHHKD